VKNDTPIESNSNGSYSVLGIRYWYKGIFSVFIFHYPKIYKNLRRFPITTNIQYLVPNTQYHLIESRSIRALQSVYTSLSGKVQRECQQTGISEDFGLHRCPGFHKKLLYRQNILGCRANNQFLDAYPN
jgi:hypothetical protein